MLTLNQIIKQLENVASSHANINSFTYDEPYNFGASGDIRYPAMLVEQQPFEYSGSALTYVFNVYIMDLIKKDESDKKEVLSDTLLTCLDVVALLDRTSELSFMIDKNITFNDFVEPKFDGEPVGYYFQLKVKTSYPLDRCAVPVSNTLTVVEPISYELDNGVYNLLNTDLISAWYAEDNANDEKAVNNGTSINNVSYASGRIGQAFSFDGIDKYILLNDNSIIPSASFSLSLFFYANSVIGIQCLFNAFSNTGAENRGWRVDISSGNLLFRTYNSGTLISQLTTPVIAGAWYHVVIKREVGFRDYLYLNNVLKSTANSTTNPNYHTTSYASIGASKSQSATVSNYFDGKIDAVYYYEKAVSVIEVSELYNNNLGIQL